MEEINKKPSLLYQSIAENNPLLSLLILERRGVADLFETHNNIDIISKSILSEDTEDFQVFKTLFYKWEVSNNSELDPKVLENISKIHPFHKKKYLDIIINKKTYNFLKNEMFDCRLDYNNTIKTNILHYLILNNNIETLEKIKDNIEDWAEKDVNQKSTLFYSIKASSRMFSFILDKLNPEQVKNMLKEEKILEKILQNKYNKERTLFVLNNLQDYEKTYNFKIYDEINLRNEEIFTLFLKNNNPQTIKEASKNIVSFNIQKNNFNIENYKGESLFSNLLNKDKIKYVTYLIKNNLIDLSEKDSKTKEKNITKLFSYYGGVSGYSDEITKTDKKIMKEAILNYFDFNKNTRNFNLGSQTISTITDVIFNDYIDSIIANIKKDNKISYNISEKLSNILDSRYFLNKSILGGETTNNFLDKTVELFQVIESKIKDLETDDINYIGKDLMSSDLIIVLNENIIDDSENIEKNEIEDLIKSFLSAYILTTENIEKTEINKMVEKYINQKVEDNNIEIKKEDIENKFSLDNILYEPLKSKIEKALLICSAQEVNKRKRRNSL